MRLLVALLFASILGAQSFEVAAIKPHAGVAGFIGLDVTGTAINIQAMSLIDLVTYAYNLRSYQVEVGDKWTGEDRYDIAARSPGETKPPKEQIQAMIRALLKDRFSMAAHPSSKEMPVYALTVAKNGHRLNIPAGTEFAGMRLRDGTATFTNVPVSMLANSFPFRLERPIIDRTGLTGKYDFELKLKPSPEGPTGPSGESLFTAIEEQLGLKLEPIKAVIETLVIDRAERPSAN